MSFTDSGDTQGFKILGERPIKGTSPAPALDAPDDSGFKVLGERPALNDPGAVQALLALGRKNAAAADADIDYKTGAPFAVRAQIQGAANPNEIYKILDIRYGRGNFGQDRNGQWWVNEVVAAPAPADRSKLPSRLEFGGAAPIMGRGEPTPTERRRVAVMPQGVQGKLKSFLSGTASAPWTTGGAILGGALGTPGGPAGVALGASGGAAAGAVIDRLQKWAFGTFDQKIPDAMASVANEAAFAGGATMVGPLAGRLGRSLKSGIQRFYGTREKGVPPLNFQMPGSRFGPGETESTAYPGRRTATGAPVPKGSRISEAARFGRELGLGATPTTPRAVPPVGSYAPEATSPQAKQELRNILMGKGGTAAEKQNALYLQTRMRTALQESGYSEPEIAGILRDVDSVRSAQLSTAEAGRALTEVGSRELGTHTDLAVQERQGAAALLNREMLALDRLAQAPDSLAETVAGAIVQARATFGRGMAEAYAALDRDFGAAPIVPTEEIQIAAQNIVNALPPAQVPPQIVRWSRGFFTTTADDVQARITSQQAHAVRSFAREQGAFQDIAAAGASGHSWRAMASAAQRALAAAETDIGQYYTRQLRALDTQYHEGIRKFEQREINQLVQQVKAGVYPTPQAVAALIMKGDYVNLAEQVLNVLPHEIRTRVLRADLRNMLDSATRLNTAGVQTLDGKALLNILHERGDLLERTYDPRFIGNLRQRAAELAAFDGQIDVTALQGLPDPLGIINQLERAVAAAQAADRFATRHPLGALASGDAVKVDAAVRAITRAGAEQTTTEVFSALRNDPETANVVRRYAVTRLFANSVLELPSMQKVVAGETIDRALRGLTPRQQELLFPGGLADDMRLLAKEARFLFPRPSKDFGASLKAKGIQYGMPFPIALFRYGMARFAGWIYDHPKILKFLTDDLRDNPQHGRLVYRTLIARELARGFSGAPSGKPDQQLTRPQDLKGLQPGQQPAMQGTVP